MNTALNSVGFSTYKGLFRIYDLGVEVFEGRGTNFRTENLGAGGTKI